MKKIILFSPSGYIGSFLKERLRQEPNIHLYEIMRGSDLGQYREDYDILIYSASVSYASTDKYVQDNVVTTVTMTNFCMGHGVKRIIYLSSDSVYGEVHTNMVTTQAVMVNPNIYGITKYLAEKIIAESGIAYYILRMPGVVGKVWRNNFISNLMIKMKTDECIELYNMDKRFNNILDIDDLINFIVLLCYKDEDNGSDIFLLGNEEFPTLGEVVSYIQSLYKTTTEIRNIRSDSARYFTLDVSKAVEYGYKSRKMKEIIDRMYQLQKGEIGG